MSELNVKHTPGPWVAASEPETVHGYSPEGEVLMVVYELGTNAADARLIAAAPELLAFAQWCISDKFDSRDIGTYAHTVIRKAKGE